MPSLQTEMVEKVVFIDQAFPFDYDYHRDGIEPPDPFIYFSKVNKYLDNFKDVVIAEHPQSDYDLHDWWGRKRVKGRTKELIEGADLVIAHYSKALKYAKCPIKFISYSELHWKLKDRIRDKAKEYVCEVTYID